jgi:hypothetical protein
MYDEGTHWHMSQAGKTQDPYLSKLILDMKALALLYPSDAELREVIEKGLKDTHDEQLQRVLRSLTAGGQAKKGNGVGLALGELILGSFLMVAGIVAIAPFLVGVSDPNALAKFFGTALSNFTPAPGFFTALPELVVVLAVALLLSSLYSLRKASETLREAGYVDR